MQAGKRQKREPVEQESDSDLSDESVVAEDDLEAEQPSLPAAGKARGCSALAACLPAACAQPCGSRCAAEWGIASMWQHGRTSQHTPMGLMMGARDARPASAVLVLLVIRTCCAKAAHSG